MVQTRNTEKSQALFERAKQLFPGGVNSPVRAFRSVGGDPFIVERGEGAYLIDVDGNRYVDYINSWGPLVLGHANNNVLKAIFEQAALGTSFGACSAKESELAELVIKLYPSIEMLRFVNSGTEAGMAVVRLVRAFTGCQKIIKFSGCYHEHADSFLVQAGSGVATLGLPDSPGVNPAVAKDTLTLPFNDLNSVQNLLENQKGEIAAIILEPVIGNAGYIEPLPGYLEGLRELCTEYKVLLVFDEVMTGFRVHLGGAQALYNVKPDLTMLGKVIGGGLPVGAFGGRKDIMEKLAPSGPVYQAGTLSGNPLAMAAGIATISEWSSPGVFEAAAKVADSIVSELTNCAKAHSIPLCAKSKGTMFGFFFQQGPVDNFEQAKKSDIERFKKFFHLMLDHGVYFAPSQFEAGFVSYAHCGEPLERTVVAIKEVFAKLD